MKRVKSTLLKSLLKNLNQALYSKNNPEYDFNKILELNEEYKKSRRDFILKASKAALFFGIGSTIPFAGCNNSNTGNNVTDDKNDKTLKQKPVIAIIGGGIAGLNCSYVLQKAGYASQIFEADKRVGGRIYTQENILGQGITTELGGEFIDSGHEEMIRLCNEFDLKMFVNLEGESNHIVRDAYFFNNKHYTEEQVFNEFKKVAGKIEKDNLSCGKEYDTPEAEKLDNTNLNQYINSLQCAEWLKEILITAYTAEFGTDASEQSSLNFISMIGTNTKDKFKIFGESDEMFSIKGGNQKLIDALQSKLKEQINTEHALVSIKTANNKTILKFSNQNEVTADHVVLAIPFTILRNIEMNIQNISKEKLACINELGYGQNNKILIGFNSRPWRDGKTKFTGYLFNNLIQNGWDNSHMQNNSVGIGGYTVFIGGQQSITLAGNAKTNNEKDSVPDDELQKYISELDKVFPDSKSQFNGRHKAVFWSNNPFVYGSYACYKVGQWSSISGKEIEPVGNIHFAGEHCSDDFQGFMNGGAETGRRAAEAIISQLALINSKSVNADIT